MWTAKIARTERNGLRLDIIISYTNGVASCDETISTEQPQNETWVSEQISNRLKRLNSLDVYEQSVKDAKLEDSVFQIDSITSEIIDTPTEIIPEII